MARLFLGRLTVAGTAVDLLASQPEHGSFASLDAALIDALGGNHSAGLLGPFLSAGVVKTHIIETALHGPLPPVLDFRPAQGMTVAALVLAENGTARLYMRGALDAAKPRWVQVPRLSEFYALGDPDQREQRQAWVRRLRTIDKKNWPKHIDQRAASLSALSAPSLRLLLAYLGPEAFPASEVDQPEKEFRGAQTHGVTLPVFRYPLKEPDCYVRVISGREGMLESINAYDLGAGISLGPIQFNVHRGALFFFLRRFEEGDPTLFSAIFGSLGWATSVSDGVPVLTIGKGSAAVRLVGRGSKEAITRNSGYFQSGVPGNTDFSQINKSFRTKHARLFRDAVVWPHIQELVLDGSAGFLKPGLEMIHKAGIPVLDNLRPDRNLFILKALLLSAFVRFSSCLAPLLRALAPFASVDDKLAAVERVLRAGGNWTGCTRQRRLALA